MRINDIYKEIEVCYQSDSIKIMIVRSEIDHLIYIKKQTILELRNIYEILKKAKIKGIPRIYHIYEQENQLVIIEEYINLPTLEEYMYNHTISVNEARRIIYSLCRIIERIHELDPPIIHRDIKPENIFYNGKNLYLFDFDISIQLGNKYQDEILGSYGYTAPENYHNQVDQRSDLYSLGIVYYQLLTNQFIFPKEYTGVDGDLIKKMIHIDPNKRFSSIKSVKRKLLWRKLFTFHRFINRV